jgi:NADH:ubiquinone oxidoreductase subunit F (NADH-binding)/Pyruvate/2-oxoacid:ferredoxin oxidoreductase delta subunit
MTAQWTMKDLCCDQCWHGVEASCPKFVSCFTEGPLCHTCKSCTEKREQAMSLARRENVAKPVIFVGAGTCGLGAGAGKTLSAVKTYLQKKSVAAEVVEVGCIGYCVAEPLVDVQLPGMARISFRNVVEADVEKTLDIAFSGDCKNATNIWGQFEAGSAKAWDGVPLLKNLPFFAPQMRWVLANCGLINPSSIEEYIARGGYKAFAKMLSGNTPAEVCDLVEKSGLRGRGGGGFPTGKKWKFALQTPADQKYFICNADEGDPGAFMDRAVIEGDPHRLLEGLAIGAYAIGASVAYIYIRAEYPLAIQRLKEAIARATEMRLLGNNILDSGFNLKIVIKMGAGAFVCGEETALMHSIEGKRGMPRPRPPFPAVSGLFGKPTIINNVETLANLPVVLEKGPEAFAAVGSKTSKGTKVFALSGKVVNTGLVEVAMGTSVRDLIFAIGGGVPNGKKFKAVQFGGPSGGCIPESQLDIQVDYESLISAGAMMGSGGAVVMDEDTCMVDVAKFFMDFIQRESCGKCIPCREGTKQLLEIFNVITRGRRSEKENDALTRMQAVMNIRELSSVIRETSLCGLGQSAPNPILSTLRWFMDEYEAHIYERKCPAKVCGDLLTYSITEAQCIGCTICKRKCPVDAIVGSPKSPHFIVSEKCIGCGNCAQVCPKHAVAVC